MPRIRTVKPEFWEDEVVGLLPRDARLLFIATFNMADDEGLLRWTPAYIKANAFMYDDDLAVPTVDKLMHALTDAGLVFPYIGGVARQQMACVVNFRKHQRINRPQKSKLPPPSLQNYEVRRMYARRDGWTCQLCGGGIPELPVVNDSHNLVIDHVRPQAAGGTDHPSNVRAAHQACSKSRRDSNDDEFVPPQSLAGLHDSLTDSLNRSVNGSAPAPVADHNESTLTPDRYTDSDIHSVNDSVNDSLNHSLPEGKGREGKGTGRGRERNPPPPHAPATPGLPAVVETGKPLPDRMTDAFLERYGRGNSYSRRQIRRTIADTLANDTDPDELWAALQRLGDTSKPVSAGTLQFAFSDIRRPNNVVALGQHRPSTTDARVQAAIDLGRQMQAEADAQAAQEAQ